MKKKADTKKIEPGILQFLLGQCRLHETPKFPENIRRMSDKASNEGNADARHELSSECIGLQRYVHLAACRGNRPYAANG